MGNRQAIAAGLLAGLLAGGAAVAGVVILTPVVEGPEPSVAAEETAPPGTPPVTSAEPSAEPSASPSSSPSTSPSATTLAEAFRVGEPAPPLTVSELGGGEISLAALEGKPVWVNFMATWCPPCRDELPVMNGYAARYADTGLVVVAVDVREDEAAVEAFAKELNVAFPVGLDADGTAQSEWGAYALPVHYWIDADGIVRDGALGGVGPDGMAKGLQAILPGVEVTP